MAKQIGLFFSNTMYIGIFYNTQSYCDRDKHLIDKYKKRVDTTDRCAIVVELKR